MTVAIYAAFVATLSLFIGFLSLFLHHRRWKHDQANLLPEILAEHIRTRSPDGWHRLRISIRNLDQFQITADRIVCLWPLTLRIAHEHQAWAFNEDGRTLNRDRLVQPRSFGRKIPLRLVVAHAGAKPRQEYNQTVMGSGDTHHQDFFVSLPKGAFVSGQNGFSTARLTILIRHSSSSTARRTRWRRINATIMLPPPTTVSAASTTNKT